MAIVAGRLFITCGDTLRQTVRRFQELLVFSGRASCLVCLIADKCTGTVLSFE